MDINLLTHNALVAVEVLGHILAPALHDSADQLLYFCCFFHAGERSWAGATVQANCGTCAAIALPAGLADGLEFEFASGQIDGGKSANWLGLDAGVYSGVSKSWTACV